MAVLLHVGLVFAFVCVLLCQSLWRAPAPPEQTHSPSHVDAPAPFNGRVGDLDAPGGPAVGGRNSAGLGMPDHSGVSAGVAQHSQREGHPREPSHTPPSAPLDQTPSACAARCPGPTHWEPSPARMQPDIRGFEANLAPKRRRLSSAAPGDPVTDYELRQRVYFAPWAQNERFSILGALWAEGLPQLELLAFHRSSVRDSALVRLANCLSTRPSTPPTVVFGPEHARPCSAWWPTRDTFKAPFRRLSGKLHHPLITSVRYFCPVPDCVARCWAGRPAFNVTVALANTTQFMVRKGYRPITLQMGRTTQPFVVATACTEPLWGYPRMKALYPSILEEWLAFHALKGFGRVLLYEQLYEEFKADVAPWQRAGLLHYYRRWARGMWQLDVAKTNTCTQSVAHDHCAFVSQLRSRWVAMVHGLDLYFAANVADIAAVLGPYGRLNHSEIRVQRQDCGGPRAGTASLMLSFGRCDAPSASDITPIFDPLQTLATFVHSTLATFPYDTANARGLYLPSTELHSTHLYEAFKSEYKGDNKAYDVLRPHDRDRKWGTHGSPLPSAHAKVLVLMEMVRNGTLNFSRADGGAPTGGRQKR